MSPPARPSAAAYDRRSLVTLSGGHLTADFCQGALPAILPFLVAQRGYSYGLAAALVLAATISSSVVQPLFGHVADRRPAPWLMPLGLVVGGAGIAVVGVAGTPAVAFAAVLVSGLGVAAFHPEGARYAAFASGDRAATGMSVFSVGGNVGWAVGALVATPAILVFGLAGTLVLVLPPALAAIAILTQMPRLTALRHAAARRVRAAGALAADRWGAFVRLGFAVALRSFVYFGLVTFAPLYFMSEFGSSEATGNAALVALLSAGAVGTLAGGRLADRIGTRTVFAGSMALLLPLLAAFLAVGAAGAFATLIVIGAVTVSTFSVSVVIGQEFLPNRLGVAAGVTIGLSIGLGGVGAALLGLWADGHGVRSALELLLILPPIAFGLAMTLPRSESDARRRARLDRMPPAVPEQT